jgi:CheY-like chemotaxis protein
MKVLFVDDEKWRFDKMMDWGIIPPTAVWANSALDAIDAIVDSGPFDSVFLDHDLNTFVHDPYPREITGNDVARVLCSQEWKPVSIVVHSANPVGAARIMATLQDGGLSPILKPITSFADDAHRRHHVGL